MKKLYFIFIMILFVIPLFAQSDIKDNLEVNVETRRENNNFWNETPRAFLSVKNLSQDEIKDRELYNYWTVYDAFGKVVFESNQHFSEIPVGGTIIHQGDFLVPYGWFKVDWKLKYNEETLKEGSFTFTHLSEKCGTNLSPALEEYLTKTGPWGGVFWHCTPENGRAAGARWVRDFSALWWYTEQEKDKVDIDLIRKDVLKYKNAGIESLLNLWMSNHPGWRLESSPKFATDYGHYMETISSQCNDIIHYYEFGNEDNGSEKLLYTERCRNFIGGVRKNDPFAFLANSGTAFVDISWFEQQDQRRLLEDLDILITHPYTVTSSPEEWGVYEQGQSMIDFIDKIGGFKELWSTEFGYTIHNDGYSISDTIRAEYLVRHFLIQVAAGYTRPGLFAWDGYYGIYENGVATGSVVAVHNMAKILEGYRYAGFLEEAGKPWVMVYERLGADPVVVAWNAFEDVDYSLNHTKVLDLYGNPVETDGKKVTLSHSPLYIFGGDKELIAKAYRNSLKGELERTVYTADASIEDLWKALKDVSNKYVKSPSREISSLQFRLLNALLIQARLGFSVKEAEDVMLSGTFMEEVKAELENLRLKDVDNPRLRFVLHMFEKLNSEKFFAISEDSPYENNLREGEKILTLWATKYLMNKRELTENRVWTYLYGYKKDSVDLNEKLSFVPGVATKVLGRVDNYANNPYTAKVSLELPKGWKCVPESITVDLKPGKHEPISFEITPTSSLEKYHEIITKTEIEGKPVNRTVMNDIEVLSPVVLTQIPMNGLITNTPMRFNLKNVDNVPHGGDLIIHMAKDKSVIGKYHFDKIDPEETYVAEIMANDNVKGVTDWDMYGEIQLDTGMATRTDFSCDFSVATKTKTPVTIDGDISDWADAYPIHLNKIDYTNNTFGSNWTPEDLSGTAYFKWDENYLYLLNVVKDQTFNQCLAGDSTWNQDSMQLAIIPKGRGEGFYELGLALTPKGPEAFMHNYAVPEHGGLRSDIPLVVKVSQGEIIYEAAIPWAAYEEELGKPEVGKEYFYDVLINDDDVVVPRRYMERFSISIVHERRNVGMGEFTLIE